MMHSRNAWIPVSLLLALASAWWWSNSSRHTVVPAGPKTVSSPANRAPASTNPIPSAFHQFEEQTDRAAALRTLKDLREKLKSMPPDEAVAWISKFIASGQDKPTSLSFVIGQDQALTEWPTFRSFLIDVIAEIDPAAAAELSREILTSPTSPDEWALALRNVGRTDNSAKTNDFLRAKTEALIANPEWQKNPSIGYLNAFDVLVHTDAVQSTPLISSLIQRKDRKDLAHAGFLTLDRLVKRNTAEALTLLATDPALHESRPEMIAQEFARADLRDPTQRDIIKNWLLNPARTETELGTFSATYPNNNHFISNNLLTREQEQPGSALATHDREALEIINSWAADPAFTAVKPALATMQQRLTTFIDQRAEEN